MNELVKHLTDGTLWCYTFEDGTTGLVVADTAEVAEEKVRDAYSKHGGYDDGKCNETINIWEMDTCNHFLDAPDVLEVHG